MHTMRLSLAACALALAIHPTCAFAEPGNSATMSGSAQAEVVDSGRLIKLADLRFGAFGKPTTADTITITPAGTASGAGEIATTMTMPQPASGRGPAVFRLDGTENRAFVAHIPNRITITNGAASMNVNNVTDNMRQGTNRFDSTGRFDLHIGGTLSVGAMQAPGHYSGDFQITVIFL